MLYVLLELRFPKFLFASSWKCSLQSKSKMETFIVKPSAGAMGRGIFLAQTEKEVDLAEITTSVAQTYVQRPLLIEGYKFDMRLYVLILSVDPLKVVRKS